MNLAESIRAQSTACGSLGSPMYASLLGQVADDVEAGGACAEVLAAYADAPGPAGVALRFLGSVHRLVLERRAGGLGTYYPSVGGTWEPQGGWEAFVAFVAAEPTAVQEWLDRPPQTNEVGRSAALMAGLLALTDTLGDLPVRLVEIGSSAGLNLLADRFRYVTQDGRSVGPADSPVCLTGAWDGDVPLHAPWPRIVERHGSDVQPVDIGTTEGRLALTAYVWPDQVERHERLRGALALAAATTLDVRRQSAAAAVDELALADGAATVLWHSVMWQYLGAAEQQQVTDRIEALGSTATAGAPFAHLFLEPTRRSPDSDHEFLVVLETWPSRRRTVLATSRGHGLPTVWEGSLSGDS